ncbi:hypothetical protein [Agrobacterium burrii]|uniref:Uncharacterized protein n=1 Tax=Agrobacterium burrii TaxID=2815339 RepID=A0ABS3EAZ8_9HYPH|nr:hypothetical protein [Agrobacterium burrii]MBO0129139.1 hypothetical protein [Agrobacterium burrii]
MKFNCGPTQQERRQQVRDRYCVWHKWFAWFPVRVGNHDCRWLETIERKAGAVTSAGLIFEFTPCDFKYRPITNQPPHHH